MNCRRSISPDPVILFLSIIFVLKIDEASLVIQCAYAAGISPDAKACVGPIAATLVDVEMLFE